MEILPSTIQSNLIVGVVVCTALVLVTSTFAWCAFYFLIKCCKSCKRCSRHERETEEGIEMTEQQQQQPEQQQQQQSKKMEGGKHATRKVSPDPPEPKNLATVGTRNGERC